MYLALLAGERVAYACPRVLGIDEHVFALRRGYAMTFYDLKNHKVYDVVLERSEAALESCLAQLEGNRTWWCVMDLAVGYRGAGCAHFPQARIVADRFYVIRSLNYYFYSAGKRLLRRAHLRRNRNSGPGRSCVSIRRWEAINDFKQRLFGLLLEKIATAAGPRFLRDIAALRCCGSRSWLPPSDTLYALREEIATMWRFIRDNGITEGFHTKMEVLQDRLYGFRNFQNYRCGIRGLCS